MDTLAHMEKQNEHTTIKKINRNANNNRYCDSMLRHTYYHAIYYEKCIARKLLKCHPTSELDDVGLVTFATNAPTLELLEAKRTGLFALCDEEVQVHGLDFHIKLRPSHAPRNKIKNIAPCPDVLQFVAHRRWELEAMTAASCIKLWPSMPSTPTWRSRARSNWTRSCASTSNTTLQPWLIM